MDLQATVDDILAFLVLGAELNPEHAFVIFVETENLHAFLRSQILVIVILREAHRSFGQFRVFKEGLQVNSALSNQVIGLEKIEIISLHSELIIFARMGEGEQQTVIPIALAVLVAEVGISVLPVVRVEEASDEAIGCAFSVHHLQLFRSPNDNTHLEVFGRLLGDVPEGSCVAGCVLLVDLGPHDTCALRHLSTGVGQLTMLDGFVRE